MSRSFFRYAFLIGLFGAASSSAIADEYFWIYARGSDTLP